MVSWLRRRVVPQVLQILLLFFVLAAVTTDDFAAQNVFQGTTQTIKQALCNDDPGDSERHDLKTHKYLSHTGNDFPLPHVAIQIYLDRVSGLLIPAPPDMFFQPDRAPPVSFL